MNSDERRPRSARLATARRRVIAPEEKHIKSTQKWLPSFFIGVAIAASPVVQALATNTAPAPAHGSRCDRQCLNGFVDQYLAALVAHDPSRLPLAKDVVFTEN